MAVAHKLARLVSSLLKHGMAYDAQGLEAYERQYQAKSVEQLARKARAFGHVLVPTAGPN